MRPLYLICALLVAMSIAACDQSEEAADTPATDSAEQPVAPPPETIDEAPMDEGEVDDATLPEEPVLETEEMIETDESVDDAGTVEEDVTIEEEETIEVPDEEQPQ